MIICINSKESMEDEYLEEECIEDLIGKRIQSIIGAIFLLPAVFTLISFICGIPEILEFVQGKGRFDDDLTVFNAFEAVLEPRSGVAIWVGLSALVGAYLLKGSIGAWFVDLE